MSFQINIAGTVVECSPESITVGTKVRSRLFQSAARRDAGQPWHDITGVVIAIEVDGEGNDAFIGFEIRTETGIAGADVFVDGRTGLSAIEIV